MTRLTLPSRERYDEWLAILAEFDGVHMDGSGFGPHRKAEPTRECFDAWVESLEHDADPATPPRDDWVKCSSYWIEDDDGAWVGYLSLRRTLNDFLFDAGGHIGYSVRPTRRREGHASAALRLALVEAARLGIARVLVTCDEDNAGSRRTIESCGGVYEDYRSGKRRYWIVTAEVS